MKQKPSKLLWLVVSAFSVLLALTLPHRSFSQTPSKRIRLYDPDTVCLSVMDFHLIAAKRAVADSLSRARAWVLVRQQDAIEALKEQVSLCDKQTKSLSMQIVQERRDCQEILDANMQLQIKLGKQQSWATVGKVGVVLVSMVTIGVILDQIIK